MDLILWLATVIEGISDSIIVQSFLVACIGFILTVIGAFPALIGAKVSDVVMSYGMGFAAGVMISASFTSLLIPAAEVGGLIPTTAGFLLGALMVYVMDKILPHKHIVKGFEGSEKLRKRLRTAWLLAIAIIIHNVPEGLAIGATVVESLRNGILLAIAIGIQNIPEGLAVSLPLVTVSRRIDQALWVAVLSGVVEPIAALFATILASISRDVLPYMLSLAAGAMVYVVSHEIIPETHSEKREIRATTALLIGFILMFILDFYYG